jgi:4-amino-4-deoxy-L-arabinose transferase-like glycosyltransferase
VPLRPKTRPATGSILIATIILATAAIRARLLDIPLDRDEGEYAYMGQLLLEGVAPYATAYHMKMPGIYGVYALILAVFGETARAVHLGLLLANAGATVLVFLLGRRLFDQGVALVAAAFFAVITLSPQVLGTAAYAEQFLLLPALGGVLVLLAALESPNPWRFLAAGVLFGVAVLIKQSGALFAVFGLVYVMLAMRHLGRRSSGIALGSLAAGTVLPLAVIVALIAAAGTFWTFWFWVFQYARHYGTAVPVISGLRYMVYTLGQIAIPSWPIYFAAALGLGVVVLDPALRRRRSVVVLFFLCSLLAVAVGLYFRRQYFVLLAPVVAMLAGLGMAALARRLPAWPTAALAILTVSAVLHTLAGERHVLFSADPAGASRAIYGANPFVESVEIARYIAERTTEADTIFVAGSEPQIYFYARRRAAAGYIYMYPLMESHPYAELLQRRLIEELERAAPKFMVFVSVRTSWLATGESPTVLADWFKGYWPAFDRVGVAEIRHPEPTRYYWDEDARRHDPQSPVWVGVYQRRAHASSVPVPAD